MKELYEDNSYYQINGKNVFLACNREYTSAKVYPYLAYPWLMELNLDSFISAHPIAYCPIAVTEAIVEQGICLSGRCGSCIWRESYTNMLQNWLVPEEEDITLRGIRCGLWAALGDSLQAGGFSPDCICYRTEPLPPLQMGDDPWLRERVKGKLEEGEAHFIAHEMCCPDKQAMMQMLSEESEVYLLETDRVFEMPAAHLDLDWHIFRWLKIPCRDQIQAASLLLGELAVMDRGNTIIYCPNADMLVACDMEGEGMRIGYYVIK